MLTLDKKLNCIEATASEVAAVYQSTAPVDVAPADHKAEPCEAYICVINKNDLPNIYIALTTKSKKVFVYKPTLQPADADSEQTIQEAMDFVTGMGFTMENVNLNYSTAMKTVVVDNIKVICAPGTAGRAVMKKRTTDAALHKGEKLDTSPSPVAAAEVGAPAAVLPVAAGRVVTGRGDELAALRSELKHLAGEKNSAEQAAASRLDTLKGKLKQLEEEKKTLARTLGDELAAVRAELACLATEKARSEADGENVLAILNREVAELTVARDAALLKAQELSVLLRTTAEELSSARAELESAARQLSVAAELATAQTEQSRVAGAEATEQRIEQARLALELAAAVRREQELTTANVALADDLSAMRVDAAEVASNLAAAALQEKELAVREVQTAEFTKMLDTAELSVEEQLSAPAEDEIFGDRGDLSIGGKVANACEKEAEAAVQADNSEKETAQRRHAQATLKWSAEDYLSPPDDDGVPVTGFVGGEVLDNFPLLGEEQTFFSAATNEDGSPEVSFVLGRGVSAIEYSAAEDILELQNSVNVVRISPDGGKLQNSKAYICSVGRDGAAQVYIGLYLMESCRTLVYLQDQPPVGATAYGRAIGKAMEFAEAVGFMMGPVALASDPVQRAELLDKLPVLKHVKNAQGEATEA